MDASDVRELVYDMLSYSAPLENYKVTFSHFQDNRLYVATPNNVTYILEIDPIVEQRNFFIIWLKTPETHTLGYVEGQFLDDGSIILNDSALI